MASDRNGGGVMAAVGGVVKLRRVGVDRPTSWSLLAGFLRLPASQYNAGWMRQHYICFRARAGTLGKAARSKVEENHLIVLVAAELIIIPVAWSLVRSAGFVAPTHAPPLPSGSGLRLASVNLPDIPIRNFDRASPGHLKATADVDPPYRPYPVHSNSRVLSQLNPASHSIVLSCTRLLARAPRDRIPCPGTPPLS